MALRPEDRYGSARALADDLERWLADAPVSARRDPAPARLARWARRHHSLVAAGLALLSTAVVALTAGTALLNSANDRAQRERDLARRNFRTARQTVDDYLTRVGRNPLLKEQGLHDLRQELLEAALRYYQDFLRQQGTAPGVRAEAAAAFERVGDIHKEQGRFEEAIADYDRGIALARSSPDGPGRAIGLLRMHAERIAALVPLGRFDEGIAAYNQAIGTTRHDNAGEVGATLIQLHNAGAEAYSRSGRADQGLRASLRALEVGEEYILGHPEDRAALYELMNAYSQSVRLLSLAVRRDDASRIARRGVERGEEAVRDHPRDIEIREGLSDLLTNLSCFADSSPGRAVDDSRRSVTLLDDVCRENPLLFRPRLLLSQALANLSNLECDQGQVAEARQSADRSIRIAQDLLTQSPGLPRVRENLGLCLLCQGRVLLRSGGSGALGPLRRAAGLLEHSDESAYLYNAACSLSLASSADEPDALGSPADLRARREYDAARAVELLRRAVDHGVSDPSYLQKDSDLAPIRSREDFQALIRGMEGAARAATGNAAKRGDE
jgi:tetratricopeptide (TPR) repeat protein